MPNARALACPASLKAYCLRAPRPPLWRKDCVRGRGRRASVADGGEGTLDVLYPALGGEWHDALVSDAFGRPRLGRWLELPGGASVVESPRRFRWTRRGSIRSRFESRLGELIRAVGRPASCSSVSAGRNRLGGLHNAGAPATRATG